MEELRRKMLEAEAANGAALPPPRQDRHAKPPRVVLQPVSASATPQASSSASFYSAQHGADGTDAARTPTGTPKEVFQGAQPAQPPSSISRMPPITDWKQHQQQHEPLATSSSSALDSLPTYTGPALPTSNAAIDAAEREKQLMDMMTSMVALVDDVSEQDRIVPGLTCKLMPHQVQGLRWLMSREAGAEKGGILADDMGLGKTVQTIALILSNRPGALNNTIEYIVAPDAEEQDKLNGIIRRKPAKKKPVVRKKQKKPAPRPNLSKRHRTTIVDSDEEDRDELQPNEDEDKDVGSDDGGEEEEEAENEEDELDDDLERADIRSKTTLIVAPLAVVDQWASEFANKSTEVPPLPIRPLKKAAAVGDDDDAVDEPPGEKDDDDEDEEDENIKDVPHTKRFPPLKVLVHHGDRKAKSLREMQRYDVVITTYTTLAAEFKNTSAGALASKSKKDADDASDAGGSSSGKALLFEMDWLRVVLDEAQNIKNHTTLTAKAAYALSRRATARWCLTGTPIQNSVYEVWSLIHFCGIRPFHDYAHFKENIGEALDPKKKVVHQMAVNWAMKRLHVVLQAILLRRTKETTHEGKRLIELPPKHVQLIERDFDEARERELYTRLETHIRETVQEAAEGGPGAGRFRQMDMLTMLMRLRQASTHPALLKDKVNLDFEPPPAPGASASKAASSAADDDDDEPEPEPDEPTSAAAPAPTAADDLDGLAAMLDGLTVEADATDWLKLPSTKVSAILRILDEVRARGAGEKTIVFSQFTAFLDILEPHLRAKGFKYERYDGTMRAAARQLALRKMASRTDKTVLLISFRAGSTGLNLTFCNHVILTEAWWNPALEDQAFDRAHRLGQTRETHVYKLCVRGTVDERILAMQAKKRSLAESALEGTKARARRREGLGREELLRLFGAMPV